jgi:hypothetical protein
LCGKVSQTQPVETDRLIPDAMTGPVAQQPGIRLDLYSPELLKYGRAGVVAAERHFWAASVWAAEEQIWCVPISRRRGLAARYLAEALPLLAPDTPQRAFEGHTAMWSWRLPHGEARAPLRAHLEVLAEAGAGEEMSTLVKPLVDDVAATLEAWRHRDPLDLGEADGGRLWLRRGLNLLHMDVNRLGLNPPEECLAGLAARRIAMNSRTNGTTQRKGRP